MNPTPRTPELGPRFWVAVLLAILSAATARSQPAEAPMNGTPALVKVTPGTEPGTVQATIAPRDGGPAFVLVLYYPGALNLAGALASAVVAPGQPIVASILPTTTTAPTPPPQPPFIPGPPDPRFATTNEINARLIELANRPPSPPAPPTPPPATGSNTLGDWRR